MAGISTDPAIVDLLDRQAVQMVPTLASFLFGDHEVCIFKHLQMLHYGAAVHIRKSLAEHASRSRRILEHIQNFAPATMRKGLEDEVAMLPACPRQSLLAAGFIFAWLKPQTGILPSDPGSDGLPGEAIRVGGTGR